jgi:hypothetical protein
MNHPGGPHWRHTARHKGTGVDDREGEDCGRLSTQERRPVTYQRTRAPISMRLLQGRRKNNRMTVSSDINRTQGFSEA